MFYVAKGSIMERLSHPLLRSSSHISLVFSGPINRTARELSEHPKPEVFCKDLARRSLGRLGLRWVAA